jgi:hypothetical protein
MVEGGARSGMLGFWDDIVVSFFWLSLGRIVEVRA